MEHCLNTWGYVALFVATFIASMALPVGSEIATGYGGALASGQLASTADEHHLTLIGVIVVAAVGEITGSLAGYAIGDVGGRPLEDRYGRFLLLTHKDLDRAEAWFDGRSESLVLAVRFIPLLRSFISLVAGLAEMAVVKFTIYTVIGCTLWSAALASIGYGLGSSWHHVLDAFSFASSIVAGLVVLAIVAAIAHRVHTLGQERGRPGRAAPGRRERVGTAPRRVDGR